jgi:hypothetical protein
MISTLLIYLFNPALTFHTIATTQLGNEAIGGVAALAAWLLAANLMVAHVVGRWLLQLPPAEQGGFYLATGFMNAGNFGASVILLAWGESAFQLAIIYMVAQSIFLNTVAVYLASRGRFPVGESLANLFRLPMVYAVVAAILYRENLFPLPPALSEFLVRGTKLAGGAAIPLALVLLGVQLAQTQARPVPGVWRVSVASTLIRLVISPATALIIAVLLRVDGLLRPVFVLEAAMPSAVNGIALAVRFGAAPGLVSNAVVLSTAFSLLTVSLLLTLF